MNFFKRALASVTRRKGKSIILFAVVFILGNVIAGAISIQQATNSVEKNIKGQLGGTATITVDFDKFEEDSKDGEVEYPGNGNRKEVESIGQLPYVKYYDFNVNDHVGVRKFKTYQPEEGGIMYGGSGGINKYLSIKGVNYPEVSDIQEQKIELASGRVFEQGEIDNGKAVAIISDKVAEANNLSVGDTMVVDASASDADYSMNGDMGDEEGEDKKEIKYYTMEQPYEVIGIFKIVKQEAKKKQKEEDKQEEEWLNQEIYNTIYTTNDYVVKNTKNFKEGLLKELPELKEFFMDPETGEVYEEEEYINSVFVLKSPEDAEAFRDEAQALLESKYNKILLSTDQYDAIAGPVKGMSKIATYVIIVAVGATLLIISLVVLLFLRDRKHELGIYLSLGEKRGKVIGQILIEVLLISFVAITLSVFTGNILAKGISSSLIETQLASDEEEMNYSSDYWELQNLTGNKVGAEDVADSYDISLSLGYVVIFYVVGLGTILLSTVVPLIYILRLNPKKIMM